MAGRAAAGDAHLVWFAAMQRWAKRVRRNAIALGLLSVVVCLALGFAKIGWNLPQGFLGGLTLGFLLGWTYLIAANRTPTARAIVVQRWIVGSQLREWADVGAGKPIPKTIGQVDAWLAVAPRSLTTDIWAGGLFVAFGVMDRARAIEAHLMAGDNVSQFYARRLAVTIALYLDEPVEVEPLNAVIADLPAAERWRALGSMATLSARAAASLGADPLAVLASYSTLLPPDPEWRTKQVRKAISYAGLVFMAGITLAFLLTPLGFQQGQEQPTDGFTALAGLTWIVLAAVTLVVVLVALVIHTRRWIGLALVLTPACVALFWLSDQLYRSRVGVPTSIFGDYQVLQPFEWMSLPFAASLLVVAAFGAVVLRGSRVEQRDITSAVDTSTN